MVGDSEDGQPARRRSARSPTDASPSTSMWSTRPLTSTEITAMLRSLLGVFDDPRLTSHSLKTTCLSWCAKADVSREHRRILGRHTSAVVDADSIYSRDLMYGPVVALEKVMSAICEGRFNPDAPRSQYLPTAPPICRTPRPAEFQGPGVVPMTPRVNIEHQTLAKPTEESALSLNLLRQSRKRTIGISFQLVMTSLRRSLRSAARASPNPQSPM